ncbi:hypothetical protein Nocox_38690 [Nonomuraea coxensis DSM 45129]|uniref:Secreted protein n=1 Tax=Nonomuraea coxensis DSM 45129 TaxID=1122611 RepID=A0ABX8UC21_9ACTN|nr:hypothetical protein [Nonomuraea coxensis]QYC45288.1 hypothetical protein Nocox_38690 [Nonomuraea coxensis DSM 45129]
MNIPAKLGTAVVAGAITVGGLTAAPAEGSTAAAASWCVSTHHWTGKVTHNLWVTNNCGYAVTYQIKRRGPDSDCLTVSAHSSRTSWWQRFGRQYQGIRWWCA